jgi:hypothetical protein
VYGVEIAATKGCTGTVWRTRISHAPPADRASAIEARMNARLDALGVEDRVVRDKGEVPHGEFRARMIRSEGTLNDSPWASRVTATFVTRREGRFYVEIRAVSLALDFVSKRRCFDAVTAAVAIEGTRH